MEIILSPKLIRLESELLHQKQIRISVLRLDTLHSQISGNKYFKLKYNLEEAQKRGNTKVLTFGGAYSNHIYATAAAAQMLGLESIGIIRGERREPLNATLAFAQKSGMHLHFVSREAYRQKDQTDFKASLQGQFGDFYLIPEGGSNAFALEGLKEILGLIKDDFQYIGTACGTGATMAGLMLGLKAPQKVIGFSALKGGGFLWEDMKVLLQDYFHQYTQVGGIESLDVWMRTRAELMLEYHFGGYAKNKPELRQFISDFEAAQQIPIEWIYTGKMFFGLLDLVKKDYFKAQSHIVALHTGGLRG